MSKGRFDKLLEPGYIGSVKTRNRIIKTCALNVSRVSSDKPGHYAERLLSHYEATAKGGTGLIIVGNACVDFPRGAFTPDYLRVDEEILVPLTELAGVIHAQGCPVFVQLAHAGPRHMSSLFKIQPISASPMTAIEIPKRDFDLPQEISTAKALYLSPFDLPREATLAEIHEIVNKFVQGAQIAKTAGFDGIEINAASDHFLNSFLSRVWNKRTDAYGFASLESRARIVVEILQETKKLVGKDFPVSVIINGAEINIEKGTTLEENQAFAQMFEKAGADAIHVRAWGFGDYISIQRPDVAFYMEPPEPLLPYVDRSHTCGAGALVPMAAAIKKVVSIPVIAVGHLDHEVGERVLEEGKADFIGMARALIADPELPNKVAAGKLEDIAPCTACHHCFSFFYDDEPIRCRTNAAVGIERQYALKQTGKRKRVIWWSAVGLQVWKRLG